ncbi:uncharacterized protein [Amphiura filiformis]|uniref:uncharacterized protein n=1 Tax=Amphiura filiformis TaxID=82378 RepID=UPI003B213155
MAASTNDDEPDETIFGQEESTLDGKITILPNVSHHLRSEDFADEVTLIVGDKRFSTHRSVLAESSLYFQRMFYGGTWKEGSSSEVRLVETPSCEEVFGTFLSYFYNVTLKAIPDVTVADIYDVQGLTFFNYLNSSVTLTKKTVIPVVTLADKYDVQGLKQMCSTFIVDMLNINNDVEEALGWVAFAEQMRMDVLQQRCCDLICYDFDKAKTCNLFILSLKQILTILKRSDIIVSNEYTIFEAIEVWLLLHDTVMIGEQEVNSVFSHIQFKNMTIGQLRQVENSLIASLNVCKENNLLRPYLNDALKYVAAEGKDHYPEGDNEPAKYHRCYTASELFGPLQTVTFNGSGENRCANVTPIYKCTLTRLRLYKARHFTWELGKFGSTKYQIRLPKVTYFWAVEQEEMWGHGTFYLYKMLPKDICLKLILIIRDQDGRTIEAMTGSFVAQIPREDGKIIVEFPESSSTNPGCVPHDVRYCFSIENI